MIPINNKILIVDDEPDFLDIMSEFLDDEGYNTTTALNGNIALNILKENKFDLVISDINMPKMKGFELLKIISELYPDTKRILITAYNVHDYINLAKEYNIGNIITKTIPFNFEEIKILVKNILTEKIFGLEPYMNNPINYEKIKTFDQVKKIIEKVTNLTSNKKLSGKIKQAFGEIILNAFFYGAKNNTGDKKEDWDFEGILDEQKEITVSWSIDNDKLGISVQDQKGKLSKKEILYWLERNISKNASGQAKGLSDEHGRGLFVAIESTDRLIINTKKNKKTEIIMINYIDKIYSGYKPLWIQEI